jgi:hypothetical protein
MEVPKGGKAVRAAAIARPAGRQANVFYAILRFLNFRDDSLGKPKFGRCGDEVGIPGFLHFYGYAIAGPR